MKIYDMINDDTKRKLGVKQNSNRKGRAKGKMSKNNRKTRLTKREVLELMGTDRPTYKRGKGGAIRQR